MLARCLAIQGNMKIESFHSNAALLSLVDFFNIDDVQLILTLLYHSLNLVINLL